MIRGLLLLALTVSATWGRATQHVDHNQPDEIDSMLIQTENVLPVVGAEHHADAHQTGGNDGHAATEATEDDCVDAEDGKKQTGTVNIGDRGCPCGQNDQQGSGSQSRGSSGNRRVRRMEGPNKDEPDCECGDYDPWWH